MKKIFLLIILSISILLVFNYKRNASFVVENKIYESTTITLREETGFKIEDSYLTGIEEEREVSSFDLGLDTSYIAVILDKNNTAKTSGYIFTGDKVQVKKGSTKVGEYTVLVLGDTNGDGKISSLDYVKIKNHIMGMQISEEVYLKSADCNSDNKISSLDYIKVKNYIMEKSTTKYTITYNTNGGSGTMSKQSVTANTTTNLLRNTFTKEGNTFNGWSTKADGSGTTYKDVSKIKVTKNITLYAQWKIEDTYTITYNLNGGTNPSSARTTYKATDATFSLPKPTKTNYVFIGWYDNSKFSGKAVTKINTGSTGNKVFYARWIGSNQFLVQYDCNGGSGAPSERILTEGEIFVPAYNTCKKSGKEFNAWLNAEGTDWTFKAISNYKNGEYGITNNIIKLKAQWTTAMSKNSSQVKPDLTGKTKLTCKDLFSKNSSNPKNVINVYCEYSSSALKYIIVKPEWNYLLTYIWVKDSYKQTSLAIASQMSSSSVSKRNLWKTSQIIDNEISTKGYTNKSLVAFNASAMVSESFYTDVPDDWKYGPANQYLKSGGKLIRNSVNNADDSKNKYWLSSYRFVAGIGSDGALKYYTYAMRKADPEYTDDKRAINDRIIEYVENNGINDTFSWTETYRNYYYESGNKEEKTTLPDEKGASPALCQLDLNNFVFITQSFNNGDIGGRDNRKVNGMNTLQIIRSLGCNRALRVDGGGSTAIWAKDGSGTYGPGRAHDWRDSCDLFYFVEQ